MVPFRPYLPPPIPHFPLLHNLQAKNGDPTLTLERIKARTKLQ